MTWWIAGGCALGAVSILVVAWRRAHATTGAGLAIVTLAVMTAALISVGSALPARTEAVESGGRVVEVIAGITSSASVGQDGRLWFEAQTASIGVRGEPRSVSVPVRIGVEPGDGFDLGAEIRVVGEAAATDAGERSVLVIYAGEAEIVQAAQGVFGVAADLRQSFIERAARLPEPGAGLLPGLAVGDTRAVSTELNDDMRTTGLSHLTAVSGANCAIVVGAVFWLSALCGCRRGLRVLLSAAALSGFVILVTPEPSVIRAAVMAGIAMLTVLIGRPRAGAGMLALGVTGILLVDPWLAATPGFALSAAASAALILFAPPLARGLARMLPAPLALAIAVPLSAQLVCGPIIALFAEQQSLIGVVANLLAAPAAPVATVVGMLACLAAPVPLLADLLAASAWLPTAWIATTATTAAQVPLAQVLLPAGIPSALFVAAVSAAIGVVLLRRPSALSGRAQSWWRWSRRCSAIVLIVVSGGGAGLAALDGPLAPLRTPEGWAIAACDVGQGDALVVRSAGDIALIDTGPEPDALRSCLRSLGVERIDLLVLTHFDLDHAGGVEAVEGRVGEVLHGPTSDQADQRSLDRLEAGGAVLHDASAGLHGVLGATSWRVLWPQRDSVAFPAGNDASVVVEFAGGEVPRSLFLGDLSAAPQRMLMRTAQLTGGYAVVKVAHHGSADQEPGLYEAVHATLAIFSVGTGNDYGHPREDALALLEATGSHLLRTDQQGRILIGMQAGELQVWTESSVGGPG
ncbi:ComEC/Rec2 family competence protein [Microbacterium sp. SSW1-49]|uniref:ComEC/Rec2 family competence protein n=2 Tax=Microbacterium croceum TaxID=2851645 RepID=A0ABT0FH90_9MICO|nr:ComEC/Rec2 family competence protein [Microbacterium croceum]